MTWGVIATWRMAHDGVVLASELLKAEGLAGVALEQLIQTVENYPFYKPVGYGGLPNEAGIVELDAAYMDGDTLAIGAVAGIQDVKNPISVAKKLSCDSFNNFRIGLGAGEYATLEGFTKAKMLTERAEKTWRKRLTEIKEKNLTAYDGHDTVGAVTLNSTGSMAAGTSSSGLFMKKPGRIGDSALSGSGFYVDSEIGGAAATGLGEDLMKGVLCYEIVRLMEAGLSPQAACDQSVYSFEKKLIRKYGKARGMSIVAMNHAGEWGVATNVEFTFSVANHQTSPQIMLVTPGDHQTTNIEPITQQWLDDYERRIKAPI